MFTSSVKHIIQLHLTNNFNIKVVSYMKCINLNDLKMSGMIWPMSFERYYILCTFLCEQKWYFSVLVIFGEDVAFGGVFRCTVGLKDKYG